jgi:hypothetical protein
MFIKALKEWGLGRQKMLHLPTYPKSRGQGVGNFYLLKVKIEVLSGDRFFGQGVNLE